MKHIRGRRSSAAIITCFSALSSEPLLQNCIRYIDADADGWLSVHKETIISRIYESKKELGIVPELLSKLDCTMVDSSQLFQFRNRRTNLPREERKGVSYNSHWDWVISGLKIAHLLELSAGFTYVKKSS